MRIVSLLGSATEIVHALGLEEHLLGISHECDYPPQLLHLPRLSRARFDPTELTGAEIDAAVRRCMAEFGSVYEIDTRRLEELHPDLVLTQAVCEVCAVPTLAARSAIETLSQPPILLSLDAHTIRDILDTIELVGQAAGAPERGRALTQALEDRLAAVHAAVEEQPRPKVLLLEWLEPPFAPGHWVPEMVESAGGDCLVGRSGARSDEVAWGELADLDPDVLLIEPCGYDLETASVEADRNRELLRSIAPRAIADGKAWVLHSAWFSRSGPRVVEGVECLARLFHPGRLPGPANPQIARPWH